MQVMEAKEYKQLAIAITGVIIILFSTMQQPMFCPIHLYTLVIILNETESYQQLLPPHEDTIVANVSPEYLPDNALLNVKVLVRNTFSNIFYETGPTKLCKYIFC